MSNTDGDLAHKESELFASPPATPSVHIPLWGGGYLTFNPDNHVPVFALLALLRKAEMDALQAKAPSNASIATIKLRHYPIANGNDRAYYSA